MTTTTIRKWGNSFAVRIPLEAMQRLGLREGEELSVSDTVDGLSLTPVMPSARTLKEMVKRINPQNRHAEQEWGAARGKEVW